MAGWACALADASESAPPSSGYDLIPKKNVFKLKEPPQQLPIAQTNPPLPKVYLTGISTMMNQRLAFLRAPGAGRTGTPGGQESLMLAEGQRAGDIQVLEVDPSAGRVKIRQAGEIVDLTFEKDGIKSNLAANLAGQPQPLANPPLPQAEPAATQDPAASGMQNMQNPETGMIPQNPAATGPVPPALPNLPAQQNGFNRLNRRLPSR